MIKVNVFKRQDLILGIEITGHAQSAEYGKDLVCAGVSAIAIGLNNALDTKGIECDCVANPGYFKLNLKDNTEVAQVIMYTGVEQLKTIQENYSKYIRIGNKEV
jgi:hypothetical protein